MKIIFQNGKDADFCIIGGAGHVGLPLAIILASKGQNVLIHDINKSVMDTIQQGHMPFMEHGAEPLLKKVLSEGRLAFSADIGCLQDIPIVVMIIGTPIDEFFNPDYKVFKRWMDDNLPFLSDDQLLILRSTVYPGTTQWLHNYFRSRGKRTRVAYCPERIVQGDAIEELQKLPQIVSGTTPEALQAACDVFRLIAPEVVEMTPIEAEFAKLFANAYRYIEFAVANQFYMITHAAGVDYYNILEGLKKNYPRCDGIPRAGFAAGPCLFKDTMQLSAFATNQFSLGQAAMLVNEGLILYIADQLLKDEPLHNLTVGLIGMAFKPDIDDTRSSLSYKLKKILAIKVKEVLTTDPHVTTDPDLLPVEEVIDRSDLLILCVPHSAYKGLDLKNKRFIDIWGFMRNMGAVASKTEPGCCP